MVANQKVELRLELNGLLKLIMMYNHLFGLWNYMHSNYAMLFICAMLCDGTCSKFITFLYHVDVEGKQVQIKLMSS